MSVSSKARNGNLTIGQGLYVAFAGFSLDAAGVGTHTVVTRIGKHAVATLEQAREALLSKADGETTVVRYFNVGNKHNEEVRGTEARRDEENDRRMTAPCLAPGVRVGGSSPAQPSVVPLLGVGAERQHGRVGQDLLQNSPLAPAARAVDGRVSPQQERQSQRGDPQPLQSRL